MMKISDNLLSFYSSLNLPLYSLVVLVPPVSSTKQALAETGPTWGETWANVFLLCLKGDAYACAYYQFCRLNYRSGIISFLHNIVHSSSVYISDVVLVAVNAALGNILNPGDFQS